MPYRIGVDTGGTFVDVVLSDGNGGLWLAKALANPNDRAGAVLVGITEAAKTQGLTARDLLARTDRIVHGSTVATNALLTGTGTPAALLTTSGFRDVLNLRRGVRDRPMDCRRAPPQPLIPRQRIFGIEERLDCEGAEVQPIDRESLEAALASLEGLDVDGVAVCFMFSFLEPAHEEAVRQAIQRRFPRLHVSLSSEVLPEVRLYERVSTTAVNAVVSPVLGRYLGALVQRLANEGFGGSLLLVQSNGGVSSPRVGERFGVRSVLSGPAAAPVAAAHVAGQHGLKNAISVDMGGTSFDVCLIEDGAPHVTTDSELAGHRIALPMVAIHTIGAGGGSIVGVDSRGMLSVGPASAGADPGPVCYGRGGTLPTVTDANLVLGFIAPDLFWGGRLRLDVDAATAAFQAHVGEPLGLDAIRAAYGAYQVVNENMVDAIREVSIRRGHDPRHFALVAVGGAGPLHVGAMARELEIPLVLVPRLASVFCALGGLLSDLRYEYSSSLVAPLAELDLDRANGLLDRLQTQASDTLRAEGVAAADATVTSFADLRYVGQFHEITVPIPNGRLTPGSVAAITADFHQRHESVNGYQEPSHALELVNLRLTALGRTDKPAVPELPPNGLVREAPARAERPIYWDDRWQTVPVCDGLALHPGHILSGPAIVEQETTTLVVPPGFDLLTDARGNGLMVRSGTSFEETIARLGGEAA